MAAARAIAAAVVVLAAPVAIFVTAVFPAAALAAAQPKIERDYVWEGELVAQLNTEGLDGGGIYGAVYQFQVVRNTDEYATEISCPPRAQLTGTDGCGPGPEVEGALPIGYLPPGSGSQWVTLDPASVGIELTPGTTYHFRVLAAPKIVTEDTLQWESPPVYGPDQTITSPAAQAPAIEGQSTSHVTSTDATLQATINPEAAERNAYYQFQLVTAPSEYLSAFACPAEWSHNHSCELSELDREAEGLPLGQTSPGAEGQPVSLDLAKAGVTLRPDTTYHYRVITARRRPAEEGPAWEGPIVYGPDQTFTTPPGGAAPVIEAVSLSHLSARDATLEATIDTEDLATTYQFVLQPEPCSQHGVVFCELVVPPIPLPSGRLLGSFVGQSVSVDLNSVGVTLRGGEEYSFSVRAANADGSANAQGASFQAPPTEVGPLQPVIPPAPVQPVGPPPGPDQGSVSQAPASPTPAGQAGGSDGGGTGDVQTSLAPTHAGRGGSAYKRAHHARKRSTHARSPASKRHRGPAYPRRRRRVRL